MRWTASRPTPPCARAGADRAGRGFCAGQDLADAEVRFVPGDTPRLGDVVERHYKLLVMRLANLRVPTVAAVNGVAAGAGASLALACDMVIVDQRLLSCCRLPRSA